MKSDNLIVSTYILFLSFCVCQASSTSEEKDGQDEILCSTMDGHYEKLFSVFEKSPDGTFLGQLDIVGDAGGPDQNINLLVKESGAKCGEIPCVDWVKFDPVSQNLNLNVSDNKPLDKDGLLGVDEIVITITCQTVPTGQKIEIPVTIKVGDVNDNDPTFVGGPFVISVNELTPVGTTVFNVVATDLDKFSRLSYSILSNDGSKSHQIASSYFEVPDPQTCNIVLKQRLDYEKLVETGSHRMELEVEVTDVGGYGARRVERKADTTVTVIITDGDDHPPEFKPCRMISGICQTPIYRGYIQEGVTTIKSIVLKPAQISAFDPDLEIRQRIVYELVEGYPASYTEYFYMDSDSADLRLKKQAPSKKKESDFTLYVKACQNNNRDMCSLAQVKIQVMHKMEDKYPPIISNQNMSSSYVTDSTDVVTFVRVTDLTLFQFVATDEDHPADDQPDFTFVLSPTDFFKITSQGYVIAENSLIKASGIGDFTLSVQARNPLATGNDTELSDPVLLRVTLGTATNCCNLPMGSVADFTSAFIVFIVLFVLCAPVIAYLAHKMRKYKAAADSKKPYVMSQSFEQKYDSLTYANSALREDATSFASSVRSLRQGHVQIPPIDEEVPHITPIDAHAVARKKVAPDEDISGIVPYQSSSSIQDWSTEDIVHSLSLSQIRVENWLSEDSDKKCGVGEVNLGSPSPCFVKILKGRFGDKVAASDDVSSMSHVLHYKSCDHPNIVKFYGSCLIDDSLYIVSEFISSRNLRNVLISSRTLDHSAVISTLSGSQLINFSIGIAQGLFYLHGNDVVHGALCARNILINDRLVPKISECCGERSKRPRLKSCRWSAPETQAKIYTEKSDVWSFGVLVWEILSLGGVPFDDLPEDKVQDHVARQLQTGGSLLPITRNTTKRLWLLLQSCWHESQSARPTMNDVNIKLKNMKDASNVITVAKAPGYKFFPATSL